jgi:4-hydroxy-4-methyl-2-oxoglutarate aldolase
LISAELQSYVQRSTTCAASDVLMKLGIRSYMRQRIRALDIHSRMFGRAVTIERVPLAALAEAERLPGAVMIDAIETAPAGSVIVSSGDMEEEAALWGGLLASAGHRIGIAGVVCDGPVRDPLEIMELKQPCFCTGSIPPGQAGILTLKSVQKPVTCGGVTVNPGDYVFGDSNGVIVIPAGREMEIMEAAADVEDGDQAAAKMILSGTSLPETMRKLGRI